ncbi:MAG: outer membrane lipoprotein chaperone LolA [Deltaproteobacteria bacterium]|nr:outer membrane lipoprotein chaperone LolA [Deltaproteobacteria bacterium]
MFIRGDMIKPKRTHCPGKYLQLLLIAMVLSIAGTAGATELDKVIDGLQSRYDSITALSADFTQEFSSKATKTTMTSRGRVYFKKPGKMRWIYSAPTRDEVASNGKTVWIYQPDLNQVMERPVDAAASSIATDFLTGVGKVRQQFEISLTSQGKDSYRLSLVPREANLNIMRILIDVDRTTFLVVRTAIEDSFGNETRVSFMNIKTGEARQDSFFEFKAPKGATVVRP